MNLRERMLKILNQSLKKSANFKRKASDYDTTKSIRCQFCGTPNQVSFNKADFDSWRQGELIQVAMPYLTSGERELFISGMCDKCWDDMFGGEEN